MHKLLYITFCILLTFTGCSIDDNTLQVEYDVARVVEVQLPQSLEFGMSHQIQITYMAPTQCDSFEGFEVRPELNARYVTPIVLRAKDLECDPITIDTPEHFETRTLEFVAASNGSYVFHFFTGLNDQNEPMYDEYELEVIE